MCEVANMDVEFNAGYQTYGASDSLLNYPLYNLILDLFEPSRRENMDKTVRLWHSEMQMYFNDLDVLGNFVDNHDQRRFLNYENATLNGFKSALAFSFLYPGIPTFYQGDEFAFNGGSDPYNREDVWPYIRNSGKVGATVDLRGFVKTLTSVWRGLVHGDQEFVERLGSSDFYCFSRGVLLGCFTNSLHSEVTYKMTGHPYTLGEKVCNVFVGGDCAIVGENGLQVTLRNGEPKWYAPDDKLKAIDLAVNKQADSQNVVV